MESEHKMHDAVMAGATIEAALKIFKDDFLNKQGEEKIEIYIYRDLIATNNQNYSEI